ncbi:MAG TPA: T9SS type A sorting domain-containing protein, partial [Chitinophagaceae bacterium]|nr:T9SS type A sorting domain-containing protein [Chitinophagaceae bacterium]
TADIIRCQLTSNASCANPATVISNIIVFNVTVVTAINPGPGADLGIRYFPNPVHSILYIDSLRLSDRWETAEMIDMTGNRLGVIAISNRTRVSIDVKSLLPGHYLLVLRRKNAVTYLKFIKM